MTVMRVRLFRDATPAGGLREMSPARVSTFFLAAF